MGVTSASLIVVIVVAAAVGAGVGGILGSYAPPVAVALGAGLIATIVAVIVRNKLVNPLSGAGPDEARIPVVVTVFGVIGAIAGSLAAKELLDQAGGNYTSLWLGTVAGLASAILVALLMITYHMYPEATRR
jgi:uncharacterized membrane protein AbrB (regulator of aidB expression)